MRSNLAAQSHVRISFDIPEFTAKTNAIVLNLLQAYKREVPKAKFNKHLHLKCLGDQLIKMVIREKQLKWNPQVHMAALKFSRII